MPNTKSAKKRMRTSGKSHDRNASAKSRITTVRTKLFAALAGGDKAASEKIFSEYCSVLDRATKKNTISTNAAARRKSRAQARLAAL